MITPKITHEAVLEAIEECERLGEETFAAKYTYGHAVNSFVRHQGRLYPAKAIVGVAHGIAQGVAPLNPSEFSGGVRHSAGLLERLGFVVYRGKAPLRARLLSGALRIYARASRCMAAMSKRAQTLIVGLIACSKKKAESKSPARELYQGAAFRKSVGYAERHCDQWLVLSAKHHIVEQDQELQPYDMTLSDMSAAERRRWATKVQSQLRQRFGNRKVRLVVLAGSLYASGLAGCDYDVVEPMEGLSQGRRLQWLKQQALNHAQLPRPKPLVDRLRYFLPDSQDYVDPSFDFTRESRSPDRVTQRDDRYAHEVFKERVSDGLLLSKGIVESVGGGSSRFSQSARLRLMREGVRAFYRLPINYATMGDCGAFTYVKQERPPFSVDDTVRFYDSCRFDYGISVDHIVTEYQPAWDESGPPPAVRARRDLTIDLAREFWSASQDACFVPLGVAQGWSPRSTAESVTALERIGYDYIAVGGLVPLKNEALLDVVRAIGRARRPSTRFHLLGVARPELIEDFRDAGVASFDSTSPLRRAWMDGRNNYDVGGISYSALRVPQVGSNPKLKKRISAGEVSQDLAHRLERKALERLAAFDEGRASSSDALSALVAYEEIHSPGASRAEAYRRTLDAAPWKACPCEVCRALGHHVIMFRGADRNRRRGFHNVWNFYRTMGNARTTQPSHQLSLL